MEMEGRGYSDFYRNTSEELFIRTVMESSIGMPVPTMEMLGFKNLSQNLRTDSEELFKSWLTGGEGNGCTNVANRTRQASRRISSELSNLSNQQLVGVSHKRKANDSSLMENNSVTCEPSNHLNQQQIRNATEPGMQASNLFLAKAWFNSSQPMTRSRSSELRKRYAAMQNSQASPTIHTMPSISGNGVSKFKQEVSDTHGLGDMSMSEIPNQFNTFVSPSNSSSSTFDTPQAGMVDNISSVVSMLKGTLERKKLGNPIAKEAIEDSPLGCYNGEELLYSSNFNDTMGAHFYEKQGSFQSVSAVQINNNGLLETANGSLDIELEGIMAPGNPIQQSMLSQEPSQSESSAPVVSTCFDACDDPSSLGQATNNYDKHLVNGRNYENMSAGRDVKERIYDNSKDNQKKGGLVRYGSLTSSQSAENGDPTKKRRVERSRKMAEAKERNSTPALPSDMQSLLKRCENLEKEVRSLKLNLSFMNRKDSEQTKQIEELQKENEELSREKARLLEEIERIIAEPSRI